jgi:hypothetical protein
LRSVVCIHGSDVIINNAACVADCIKTNYL